MNKTLRLSKSGIEYLDYVWNFASGCGNNVDGKCKSGGFRCWAYSISQRFKDHYPNGFEPTLYEDSLLSPLHLKKPSIIGVNFMGDLFWDCPEFDPEQVVTPNLPNSIPSVCFTLHGTLRQVLFGVIRACPQHTFVFLTKHPQNLPQWSPFPENCWVGVTATDHYSFLQGLWYLGEIEAKIKYISFEPLLAEIPLDNLYGIDWVIIGAQTKPYKPPKIEWVQEIVEVCDKAGIPVFLKDNLAKAIPFFKEPFKQEMMGSDGIKIVQLRQELPYLQHK